MVFADGGLVWMKGISRRACGSLWEIFELVKMPFGLLYNNSAIRTYMPLSTAGHFELNDLRLLQIDKSFAYCSFILGNISFRHNPGK